MQLTTARPRCRYAEALETAHDAEHLVLFEELLEAAVDLDRIPDEYLIASSYDPELQGLASAKAQAEADIEAAARDVERAQSLTSRKNLQCWSFCITCSRQAEHGGAGLSCILRLHPRPACCAAV